MPAHALATPEQDLDERRVVSPEAFSLKPLTLYEGYDGMHGERDACGIGAIVNRLGEANRTVVDLVLEGLCDLDLRGGSIEDTGDGAGVMFRTEGMRGFLKQFLAPNVLLEDRDELHVGTLFLRDRDPANLPIYLTRIRDILAKNGIQTVGFRSSEHSAIAGASHLEMDIDALGRHARENLPVTIQVLFTKGFRTKEDLPLALHRAKMTIASEMHAVYVVSMEKGTVTYKAMATGEQFRRLHQPDFSHPKFQSSAGKKHRRFGTNTFSSPELAQPFRRMCHNGEINTIAALRAGTRDLERSLRMKGSVLMRQGSDSGDLDRITSLFYSHGVPLSETFRRLFQPTLDDQRLMPEELQMYHRAVRRALGPLSAGEGPAAIIAMDSEEVVALLDGLGLRPLRIIETNDDLVVITSEIGAPHIPLNNIKRTFQLDAGEMVIVQKDGTVLYPGDADQEIVRHSKLNWKALNNGTAVTLPVTRERIEQHEREHVIHRFNIFGGNEDTLQHMRMIAKFGKEPVLGMGNDQPLAVFSRTRHRLSKYFKQIVAVVTNPPMDFIREGAAMDTRTYLGRRPKASVHGHEYKPQPHIDLEHPFLSEEQFQNLLELKRMNGKKVPSVYRLETRFQKDPSRNLEEQAHELIEQLKREAVRIARGKKHSILVLSDRGIRDGDLYIPPAKIVAAIHNELTECGLRRHISIVSDTGEAFEAHDMALLVAMGADAVNPYLAWQAIDSGLVSVEGKDNATLRKNVMTTYVSTLKRIMSKMGIVSVEGYRGSKLMEAVGIDPDLIGYYMGCPVSNIGGITLRDIMTDIDKRSKETKHVKENLDRGGYNGDIRKLLEKISWGSPANPDEAFRTFAEAVERHDPVYLRDLLGFQMKVDPYSFTTARLDELGIVSVEELFYSNTIVGAAMSVGALDPTAHRAISGAFNELGGSSNTGEGGLPRERNPGQPFGADTCKIRQRASALFGFNAEYAIHAEEIEIKIGQGAKPGEGGHLPGFKVGPFIAKLRHTQVGIDLISPPPLHDVYSIEDLARLIQDLRAINPRARIAVKITANTDLGTVAVGVAKAGADIIALSGIEGGTGAAVSSALDHTGLPLEKSLAEVHQALVRNKLRHRVKLRVDGSIKTGDDIVTLACLGANDFALGTALLVAGERCIFCHSCSGQAKGSMSGTFDQCPTDIMPIFREGKLGLGARKVKAEERLAENESYHRCKAATKHYLTLLAQDVRRRLAAAGKRTIEEIVGDTTLLKQISRTPEADRLKLDALLQDVRGDIVEARREAVEAGISLTLSQPAINEGNQYLIDQARRYHEAPHAERPTRISMVYTLTPEDRNFGATLAGQIAKGDVEVPPEGFHIRTDGYAGQSLGVGLVDRMTIEHTGFGNDFIGMAMSGGKIVLKQPSKVYDSRNSVGGNACGYGASGGNLYGAGKFGQRFGVRNCGATLVSEGTGKYPYEYMTGGIAVDLRRTGNQACAGQTGGRNFLLDSDGTLSERLHADAMITNWTKRDRTALRSIVEEYHADTQSPLAVQILYDFDREFESFKRVVPRDHYANAVATVWSYDFYRLDDTPDFETVLEDAAIELTAYLGFDEDFGDLKLALKEAILAAKRTFNGLSYSDLKKYLVQSKPELDFLEEPKVALPPYRFEAAKSFARAFLKGLLDSPPLPAKRPLARDAALAAAA